MHNQRSDAEMKRLGYSWFERLLCCIGLHDNRETGLLPNNDPFMCGSECRKCLYFHGTMRNPTMGKR